VPDPAETAVAAVELTDTEVVLAAVLALVICAVVFIGMLAVSDWRARRPAADPLAEVVAIGQECDPDPVGTRLEGLRIARLLIEMDREIEQATAAYRGGVDITAGAPKEWTP